MELDTVARRWQLALDGEQRALNAATHQLRGAELADRSRALAVERRTTVKALNRLADVARVRHVWLSPFPVSPQLLRLRPTTKACLFDLDGVLADSGVLHAAAWAAVFDEFLRVVAERNGWHFIPFDRNEDYVAYLDGRPRLEGIHAFLESRGLRVPEGRPGDPPEAETAHGLARHKADALARALHENRLTALPGARRYLEAAGYAGLKRATISASQSTAAMLEIAGLASLVDERMDADLMSAHGLRSRPAPDVLIAACSRLGVDSVDAVSFTHSPAGVVGGQAAGMEVIGVGDPLRRELLRRYGAERVVPSLSALLDHQLTEAA